MSVITESWMFPLIHSKAGLEFDLVDSNVWPEPWYGRVFHTGGQIAGSLAVITDAAHILVDLTSFLISLFSLWLASKPPTKQLTFGWHRAGSKKCHSSNMWNGKGESSQPGAGKRPGVQRRSAAIQRQCTNVLKAPRTHDKQSKPLSFKEVKSTDIFYLQMCLSVHYLTKFWAGGSFGCGNSNFSQWLDCEENWVLNLLWNRSFYKSINTYKNEGVSPFIGW